MANESIPHTNDHIKKVQDSLRKVVEDLMRRGMMHDVSKFNIIELAPLDEVQRLIDEHGPAPYGSEEYTRRTEILKPMLEHHYAENDHHPEHYDNGIAGMSLLSLMEMFADWRAANLQRDAGAPMNLSFSIERLKIEPQLAEILKNTADQLGWEYK